MGRTLTVRSQKSLEARLATEALEAAYQNEPLLVLMRTMNKADQLEAASEDGLQRRMVSQGPSCETAVRPRRQPRPRTLRLTPELFAELDQIARLEAGCVLSVGTFEELGRSWGRFSMLCGDAYIDARRPFGYGSKDDAQHIQIAVVTDIRAFRACHRPEMNWRGVPDADIYRFILHHEVGHKLNNFCTMSFMSTKRAGGPEGRLWLSRLSRINEVLADRYAWTRMYPGKPMPVAVFDEDSDRFDKEIAELSSVLPLTRPTPRPERTEPWAMIPDEFVKCDKYFWLLGDPTDPNSRAGILRAAWRNYPFYVGVRAGGEGTSVERVGPFVEELDDAIYSLALERSRNPEADVFEVIGAIDNSTKHRRLNLPRQIVTQAAWRAFERADFPITVLGAAAGQVWLARADLLAAMAEAFVYDTDQVLASPGLMRRLPTQQALRISGAV